MRSVTTHSKVIMSLHKFKFPALLDIKLQVKCNADHFRLSHPTIIQVRQYDKVMYPVVYLC